MQLKVQIFLWLSLQNVCDIIVHAKIITAFGCGMVSIGRVLRVMGSLFLGMADLDELCKGCAQSKSRSRYNF